MVYADNDNFHKQIGDQFLTDDDYSELNHIWNKENIMQSWTASYSNGYYYPLIDYGQDWDLNEINGWSQIYNTQVRVGDMFPATSVKYIWDKIFSNAGYTYNSKFLNTDIFKNLYIPFNKAAINRDSITQSAGRFTVGFTQSLTYVNDVAKVAWQTMLVSGPNGLIPVPNIVPVVLLS